MDRRQPTPETAEPRDLAFFWAKLLEAARGIREQRRAEAHGALIIGLDRLNRALTKTTHPAGADGFIGLRTSKTKLRPQHFAAKPATTDGIPLRLRVERLRDSSNPDYSSTQYWVAQGCVWRENKTDTDPEIVGTDNIPWTLSTHAARVLAPQVDAIVDHLEAEAPAVQTSV